MGFPGIGSKEVFLDNRNKSHGLDQAPPNAPVVGETPENQGCEGGSGLLFWGGVIVTAGALFALLNRSRSADTGMNRFGRVEREVNIPERKSTPLQEGVLRGMDRVLEAHLSVLDVGHKNLAPKLDEIAGDFFENNPDGKVKVLEFVSILFRDSLPNGADSEFVKLVDSHFNLRQVDLNGVLTADDLFPLLSKLINGGDPDELLPAINRIYNSEFDYHGKGTINSFLDDLGVVYVSAVEEKIGRSRWSQINQVLANRMGPDQDRVEVFNVSNFRQLREEGKYDGFNDEELELYERFIALEEVSLGFYKFDELIEMNSFEDL